MGKIYLIGLPGSGKSTVGKELSKLTNYDFIDLDKNIEEVEGKSIPTIFEKNGEEYFRKLETKALERVYEKDNIVVSCGGGIVLKKENKLLMNGLVCLLNPPIKDIKLRLTSNETSKRPLMSSNTLETLYEKRKDLYNEFKDIEITETILSKVVSSIILKGKLYDKKKNTCN